MTKNTAGKLYDGSVRRRLHHCPIEVMITADFLHRCCYKNKYDILFLCAVQMLPHGFILKIHCGRLRFSCEHLVQIPLLLMTEKKDLPAVVSHHSDSCPLAPSAFHEVQADFHTGGDICHTNHTERNPLLCSFINDMVIFMQLFYGLPHIFKIGSLFRSVSVIIFRSTGLYISLTLYRLFPQIFHSFTDKSIVNLSISRIIPAVHRFHICPELITKHKSTLFFPRKEGIVTFQSCLI